MSPASRRAAPGLRSLQRAPAGPRVRPSSGHPGASDHPGAGCAAATDLVRRGRLRLGRGAAGRPYSTGGAGAPDAAPSSVSAAEIAHFDALASSWWDPHGPSRILHLMNPLRHDFIRRCRAATPAATAPSSGPPSSPARPLSYLDIGCGGGIFAESAARLPGTSSVTALDPSAAVIGAARRHARRDPALLGARAGPPKLRYLHTTLEAFTARDAAAGGEPDGLYDVVTLFEVLEHVARPAAVLDAALACVRPGRGWLVLSTIARSWASWLTTVVAAERVLRLVPRGTHDWAKYVDADEVRRHFAAPGRRRRGVAVAAPDVLCMGVVYVPGLGWREVRGSEQVGNYFLGVRRRGCEEEEEEEEEEKEEEGPKKEAG